ncbi:MAG: hypothetical protein KJ063_24120 [Anaerolineae bacterium]|nr:hypothetical protein [Anaerolineae bacterium]
MTNRSKNNNRAVPTTILTIDRGAIDWERLRHSCYIARYKLPFYNRKTDKNYFARMHNWYKQEGNYPCYLHTHGPHLYVKYSNAGEVIDLLYEGQVLRAETIVVDNEAMLPWIMKLLTADFFQLDGRFVSNAKFFLWATADKDFVTGLEIELNHNWQENKDEFIVSDEATRLRRLRPIDFDYIQSWQQVYYGRFYPTPDMPVFKQLKRDQLTRDQLREGIYELYEGSRTNRANLIFHSTKSLHALRQTRSYLLSQFVTRFVAHLNELGLPFQQKRLPMQSMHSKSSAAMQERQLPLEQKPIYIIDDRLNATRQSDDFAAQYCAVANQAITDYDALFIVKSEADLQPGDWALRLQDYDGTEFEPDTGILKDRQDTKTDFSNRHPKVVKQTINVNSNSKKRKEDAQRQKARTWSEAEYLDYDVPTADDIKTRLEVCRNQLLLKDVVMFPQNVLARLPQIEMMADMIFLYQGALIYFDGQDLCFMSVANNLEAVVAFVQKHSGWDLHEDVLLPSIEQYYFNSQRDGAIADTLKRPFIIGRDFVWEIWEGNGRVLNEDVTIQERLEALEQVRLCKEFYPPHLDSPLFTAAQLRAYAEFLDKEVRQTTVSYVDLKAQYGKHIKDERGTILVKDGGFFNLLGISNAKKYREYLKECVGLPLESVREDHLFPVYKGIWYSPNSGHYVAGVKDTSNEEQERGHTLRRIVVHQGIKEPDKLKSLLAQSFFPLLEVNFIRYKNYTVRPFPFQLIDIWQKVSENNRVFSDV